MPDVRLPHNLKREINQQPERTKLKLSFCKTTSLLIEEALVKRREELKSGPKLGK